MAQTNNTKQAAWVAIGSLCSHGFAIVSSMILSRYFIKADYGTYKQVMYVYGTLLVVFTLGLPRAYSFFLPRVDLAQSKSLIRRITGIFFILGGVFSLLLFTFAPQFADYLKNLELIRAIRIFSIVPFFILPTMGLDGILATFKKSFFIALYHVVTNVLKLLCVALPVMIWKLGVEDALWGFVLASVLSFILALSLEHHVVRFTGKEKCTVSYREIFRFSIPLLLSSLWGVVITSADQFFISRYFGTEVFAEFSNGSMELPFVGMITGACATVLSPIFSKMSHEKVIPRNEVYPLWMSVFEKTAKLIYPMVIYCLVFADVVMVVLYGEAYAVSDKYFRIKLITNFFTLIAYAPLLINIGKVRYYSNVHMFVAFLVVGLEYMSVRLFNSPYAISWVSMLCQLVKTFALLWVVADYFEVRLYDLFPVKLIGLIIVPSSMFLLLERWLLMDVLHVSCFITLIISLLLYSIAFYGYSILVKMDYVGVVKPLLRK